MPDQNRTIRPGPDARSVRTEDGKVLRPPADWELLPPGDAGLTRRVKAGGPTWTVQEKVGRKMFSRGVWAPSVRIAAVRGGDSIGEHTLMFLAEGERLELTHRAFDRAIFARGALRAARWVVNQRPGLYTMADVIGLGDLR